MSSYERVDPVNQPTGGSQSVPPETSTRSEGARGSSAGIWTFIAASVLFLLGIPFVYGGIDIATRGLAHGADSGGVREVMTAFGGVLLLVGVVQIAAAILIWAHRPAGWVLGFAIGVTGTLLGGLIFVIYLHNALDPAPGSVGADLVGLLAPLPYAVVLIGLTAGRSRSTG